MNKTQRFSNMAVEAASGVDDAQNQLVSLYDMASILSSALDLVSPAVANHQKRTAYIAWSIGHQLGLGSQKLAALLLAGMLHDCGAISLKGKLDALRFDFEQANIHSHAETGYAFLNHLEAFFGDVRPLRLAELVRFHHVKWDNGSGRFHLGRKVPLASHLIHLADRVDALIDRKGDALSQAQGICSRIAGLSGDVFEPESVEAFRIVAEKESFWLNLMFDQAMDQELAEHAQAAPLVHLDTSGLLNLTRLFAMIVDFRSRFTASHSTGVAAAARFLAEKAGFSGGELQLISIAANLHDLGKLAAPQEILEKPAPLTTAEFNIIKAHPFHVCRLLSPLKRIPHVAAWASFHHECLDGSGYPFHLSKEDIPLGSRIVSVSDIFTALTEDRPYRPGLPLKKSLGILRSMSDEGKLDPNVVSLADKHQNEMEHLREQAQNQGSLQYNAMHIT